MKKNLLPNMQRVKMKDPEGQEFAMSLAIRKHEGQIYVFLTDTNELGSSRLAQNAVYYIDKICQSLGLNQDDTVFYRHIYNDQMGSLFGRFVIDWENQEGPSYKFQMLTNIEDMQGVSRLLENSDSIDLNQQVQQKRSAAN